MTEEAMFHEALTKPLAERALPRPGLRRSARFRAAVEACWPLTRHLAICWTNQLRPKRGRPPMTRPTGFTATYHPGIDAGTVIAAVTRWWTRSAAGGMGGGLGRQADRTNQAPGSPQAVKAGMDSRAVIAASSRTASAGSMDHPTSRRCSTAA